MSPLDESGAPAGAQGASPAGPGSDATPPALTPAEGGVPVPAQAEGPEGPAAGTTPEGTPPAAGASAPPRATAAGRVWVALTVGVVLVVLLIIFIAENSGSVTIKFLGTSGSISLGLAMLAAAVVGAVVTLLVGTTRILQLRREVRRNARRI